MSENRTSRPSAVPPLKRAVQVSARQRAHLRWLRPHVRPSPRELGNGLREIRIMFGLMRIASNVAVEVLLEHALGRLPLLAKTAAAQKVRTRLQNAALAQQSLRDLDVVLDGAIALGMRDDHREPHALELKNRALVILEVALGAIGLKLEQELIAAVKAQMRRPLLNP